MRVCRESSRLGELYGAFGRLSGVYMGRREREEEREWTERVPERVPARTNVVIETAPRA